MAQHTVWGSSAPPGTYSWYTDGTPSIWTAMGFYRTATGGAVQTVVGARLWVTAASLAANSTAGIRIFIGGDSGGGNTLAAINAGFAAPHETKTINISSTGWNSVYFDTPLPTPAVGKFVYIAIQYGGTDDGYLHSGATPDSGAFTPATGGWGFGLGDSGEIRSAFKIGTDNFGQPSDGVLYGLDIIFDDGGAGEDTTAPTVPTGLSIGSITHNSGVASWTASTDAVGVTGYEVFKDGVSAGTPSGTSFTLTGLSPDTEYDITVRARDASANWSAQSSAVSFTTDTAPAEGGRWINHVAVVAPGNGTTTHTVGPSSGTAVSGTLFTPTAGNLLVCVAEGSVTSSTPTGWALPSGGSAVNQTGLYVWYRTAAGGDSLSTTHNTANYPAIFDFYEFDGDSTFVASVAATGVSDATNGPTLSGLTGSNLVMFVGARSVSDPAATGSITWSTGEEIVDHLTVRPGGTVDGFQYGVAILEDHAGSSAVSAADWTATGSGGTTMERLVFAVHVVAPPSGDTEAPSVPTGVEVTPASTSATVEWNASTDNVGVTSYEVSLGGTPVGTPTATLLHLTGLTPATTYSVTVRARDSAANWSASTTAVEFTTLAATRLTIAQENALTGKDRAFWLDLGGAVGDTANVGYAKTFSNEVGTTVEFACHGGGTELQIYRLGWYGGAGARHVDTVTVTPVTQVAGTTIPSSNNGIQFSAWTVNAEWDIPPLATSGFYLGVYRNAADNNASWIPFVVTDAARDSDVVYKTADTTWMIAYNHYGGPSSPTGGGSFYGASGSMGGGGITTRAHACSYDRPYVTRSGAPLTAWSNAELPMIRWIERMGIEVKYIGCMDLHDSADCLDGASVFVSNGHDEYWSTEMRDHVEAFRDAGGHLLFASGNEVFWRIRRDATDPKIIWCYKDTMPGPGGHTAGTPLDPVSWTGTWKDTRWGSRRPENLTTGTDFRMNAMSSKTTTFLHTADYADHPVWRNSALAAGTSQSVLGIVGFEADEMLPTRTGDAVVVLANETYNIDDNRADNNGEVYTTDGILNWGIVAQRYPSGAVVIGFGTVQWSWGLDTMHDATNSSGAANLSMQQMTYNLLRDLGANSASPHTGITTSSPVALSAYGLAPAPVSEYGFENGTDKSGNGHDLIVVGSPSVADGHGGSVKGATTGPTNRFEGPIGSNTSLTDYTVMAWVKFTSTPAVYRSVLSNGSNFYFDFEGGGDGNLRLYLYSGASGHPAALTGYSNAGAVGQWIHVACTRNATGTSKVFVNGVEIASGNGNAFNFADANLEVGSNGNGTGYQLPGVIDDLRLFDRALTAAQISEWSAIPVAEDVVTTVTKTVSATWAATARITKAVTSSWAATATNSSKTVSSSWAARAQVTKTVSASWAARFTGLRQLAASWSARSRQTTTATSSWAARQQVTKDVVSVWGEAPTTYPVAKSVPSSWSAAVSGGYTVSSSWTARVRVAKFVTSGWATEGITYSVTKNAAASWAARVRVSGALASAGWQTRARLTKTVIFRWRSLSDVPVGDAEPVIIVVNRKPGGRADRSIRITRRRRT